MRHAKLDEAEFVKKAIKHFDDNPKNYSFGDLKEGTFFAMRFGLGDDCVLMFKLDDHFEPTVYGQVIKPVTT